MNELDIIYKEINRRVNNAHELPDSNPDKQYQLGEDSAYAFVLGLIEELQNKELPQGLDEAAKECAIKYSGWTALSEIEQHINIFKAGTKWMAEQGESEEDILKGDEDGRPIIRLKYSLRHLSDKFKPGDKVIVQIRKVNEKEK